MIGRWINFIGVVPYLALFDDAALAPFFSRATVAAAAAAEEEEDGSSDRASVLDKAEKAQGKEETATEKKRESDQKQKNREKTEKKDGEGGKGERKNLGSEAQQQPGPHIDRLERLLDPILCGHSRPVRRGLSGLITLALTCSIVVRSADPIKELFSASPWLHYYDDYFIINSQGVSLQQATPRVVNKRILDHGIESESCLPRRSLGSSTASA